MRTPTRRRAIGSDSAGIVIAGADLAERARGGRGLPKIVAAPTENGTVASKPARILPGSADLGKCVRGPWVTLAERSVAPAGQSVVRLERTRVTKSYTDLRKGISRWVRFPLAIQAPTCNGTIRFESTRVLFACADLRKASSGRCRAAVRTIAPTANIPIGVNIAGVSRTRTERYHSHADGRRRSRGREND